MLINVRQVLLCFLLGATYAAGCTSDEFPCNNEQCISKLSWCDGNIDCKDGTDEKFCKMDNRKDPNNCSTDLFMFLCNDGRCIPKNGKCDRLATCLDGSDEENCLYKLQSKVPVNKTVLDTSKREATTHKSTYFTELDHTKYEHELEAARKWLLSQQNKDHGWGEKTARAIIAMYLSKNKGSFKTEVELIMDKQLEIQLSLALARNATKVLSKSELALYINALTASCSNPKNFYGYDLVSILRERTTKAINDVKFISPYVLITLCVNNNIKYEDYMTLQSYVFNLHNTEHKLDIMALAVLASSCMIKLPEFSYKEFQNNLITMLIDRINKVGLPNNVYEMSLVVQALNEAKVDDSYWNRDSAMDLILHRQDNSGSFGDILATYYTIPILSGRSVLSLSEHCITNLHKDDKQMVGLRMPKKKSITITYSLYYGVPVETAQKISLEVAEKTNFLDIMRVAAEQNSNFRFNLDGTKEIPFVYSIGGIPNDPERGLYWTLTSYLADNKLHKSLDEDIRYKYPRDGDEIGFWLKPI